MIEYKTREEWIKGVKNILLKSLSNENIESKSYPVCVLYEDGSIYFEYDELIHYLNEEYNFEDEYGVSREEIVVNPWKGIDFSNIFVEIQKALDEIDRPILLITDKDNQEAKEIGLVDIIE